MLSAMDRRWYHRRLHTPARHRARIVWRPPRGHVRRDGRHDRGPRHPQARRRPRRAAIAALALVLAGITGAVALSPRGSGHSGPAPLLAPPAADPSVSCRRGVLAHVHDPGRLRVITACVEVTGVVLEDAAYQPGDGDRLIVLDVDAPYRRYLPPGQRTLPVRVIPADYGVFPLPRRGDRIAAVGAWVRNRNQRDIAELHPAWGVKVLAAAARERKAEPRPRGRLQVSISAPRTVRTGQQYSIQVKAALVLGDAPVPVDRAHLWLEIAHSAGAGVQWKAATTTGLGTAVLQTVALYGPGAYQITLYADRDDLLAVARAPLAVTAS
jgi:hypothetical protein